MLSKKSQQIEAPYKINRINPDETTLNGRNLLNTRKYENALRGIDEKMCYKIR